MPSIRELETGRVEVYRAQRPVLLPLGRRLHGSDRRDPHVAQRLYRRGPDLPRGFRLIGTGMWLALIMAFNVWFIIWPNQQKALSLVEADDATKAEVCPDRDADVAGPRTVDPDALRDDDLPVAPRRAVAAR